MWELGRRGRGGKEREGVGKGWEVRGGEEREGDGKG